MTTMLMSVPEHAVPTEMASLPSDSKCSVKERTWAQRRTPQDTPPECDWRGWVGVDGSSIHSIFANRGFSPAYGGGKLL